MTIPSCDIPERDTPSRDIPKPDGRGRRLALHFTVVLLGASVLASLIGGPSAGISTALGVALAGTNLLLMQKITSAMTASSGASSSGGSAAWGLLLPFKLVALVGVAYALVSSRVAQPVPLAMGFALLPLTGVFLPRPSTVPDLAPTRSRRRRESLEP
jgi:hypothetical protein